MRYVVLHHTDWPGHEDHYDLMLQIASGQSDDDRVLLTFATLDDSFPRPGSVLRRLPDHRRAYLQFEGRLSGERGRVSRVDAGLLRFTLPYAPDFSELNVALTGLHLRGNYMLQAQGDGTYTMLAMDFA
ncbi:MAG TPA: hypothetical protein VEK08_05540 [Planctomycetota bacterium]|nr:hypothetical protein [Planctomycetota bacterium]